jgi:hypothetical protein
MKKIEQYIKNFTRNCSNEIGYCHNKTRNHNHVFYPWLTQDQALRAVEIAREETINDMCDWIASGLDVNADGILTVNVKELVKDLKQAMKDE